MAERNMCFLLGNPFRLICDQTCYLICEDGIYVELLS